MSRKESAGRTFMVGHVTCEVYENVTLNAKLGTSERVENYPRGPRQMTLRHPDTGPARRAIRLAVLTVKDYSRTTIVLDPRVLVLRFIGTL